MIFDMKTLTITAAAFATLANSHMLITMPIPYGQSTLDTSPLVDAAPGSAGSDFPCKQRPGVYDVTKMNNIKVGEPQELAFSGSASHGGGTCQLALTKDLQPTANSTFKVFQVFEGGCPINSDGNSGSHPFTYVLPTGIPNGKMTFAWIWYNRIGNRELYMNCAPFDITGGASDDTYFDSLPNAYIVNMPTSECQTSFEGIQNAVTIPHPGQFIMKQTAGQEMHAAVGPGCAAAAAKQLEGVTGYKSNVVSNGAAYKAPAGAVAIPSGSAAGSGAPSGSAAAPSGSAAVPSGSAGASSAPAGSASAPAGSGSAPAGSAFAAPSSGAASGSAAASAPAVSAPASSGAAGSSAAAGSSFAAPSSAAAGSGFASGTAGIAPSAAAPSGAVQSGAACSDTSTAMTCSSDGKKFGVCADGKMVWRAVAPGTSCVGGQIEKRSEFRKPHLRRHAQRAGHHRVYVV